MSNIFLKNSSIYVISNILNAAIPFVLIPVLTRYLTLEEYGQVAMFQALVAGIAAFVGINAVSAANRKYFDDTTTDDLRNFNTNCFWILLSTSGIMFLLILFFFEGLQSLLVMSGTWIIMALLVSIFIFCIQFRLGQWQVRGRSKVYGVMQISNSTLNLGGSLILVVALTGGGDGRILGQLISASIIGILSIVLLNKDKLICWILPSYKQVKEIVNFGLPLVPHVFGAFLLTMADRLVINEKLGLEKAGVYMLAAQLSLGLLIIFDGINKAFAPWLFGTLKKNRLADKVKIVRYTYCYFLVLLLGGAFGFVIGPHLVTIVAGENYTEAGEIIGWLFLGQVFGGMYLMVTNYIFYSKETSALSLVTIFTGLLNVLLLFVFVDKYGLVGAGYSFCLSMFLRFVLTWIVSAKKVSMPWGTFIFCKSQGYKAAKYDD